MSSNAAPPARRWLFAPAAFLGENAIRFLETLGGMGKLFWNATRLAVRRPFDIDNLFRQAEVVGVNSLPVIALTAVFMGMVLAYQSYQGFRRFGAESLMGTVVALSVTRELGPVFAGLMVSGRVGGAMAAELGTMRVTEQIDALVTLGTNPIKYLVTPRIFASVLVMPILVAFADLIGIFGGYFVSVYILNVDAGTYIRRTYEHLEMSDIYGGLGKSMVFGLLIALMGCYQGFYTEGGAEGVGKATTRAVVLGSIAVLVSDYFLTVWLF